MLEIKSTIEQIKLHEEMIEALKCELALLEFEDKKRWYEEIELQEIFGIMP